MKNIILVFAGLLIFMEVVGQNAALYALGQEQPLNTRKGKWYREPANSEFFLKINANTGEEEVIANFENIDAINSGISSYHLNTGDFIFYGRQMDENNSVAYAVNTTTRTVEKSAITVDEQPADIQYDMQYGTLYGLKYSGDNSHLVLVKQEGEIWNEVVSLPNVQNFSVGNATFDPNRSIYIFTGTDANLYERLYSIDVNSGNIMDQPRIRQFYFNELEYDVKDNKVYGLCRKKTNTSQFFFVEISLLTGNPTIVRPIINLHDITIGTSVIDQKAGTYIFSGVDKQREYSLYTIDLLTGAIKSKTKLENRISELHCDNSAFAAEQFESTFAAANTNSDKPMLHADLYEPKEELKAVDSYLQIPIDIKREANARATIVNLYGDIVFEKILTPNAPKEENKLNLTQLDAGVYWLKLKTGTKLHTEKFIKR